MREDFCGTFKVCCEWVRLGADYTAHGRDLSEEALRYGTEQYLPRLTPAQRRRVRVTRQDVLEPGGPSPDLILAQNFSYFVFVERETLKAYFTNCRKSLRRDGVLALDVFGGAGTHKRILERTDYPGFVFWWEQTGFDPVTHKSSCSIHFKPKGRKKVRDAFTYEWRMWSIPEIRDLLRETGFRKSTVYWEGDEGHGAVEKVWIAMILAEA